MGRGKRRQRQIRLQGLSVAGFGMRTPAGADALKELLKRIDLALEPDLDLEELERELDEGLALIASYHPEAKLPEVRAAVYAQVRELLDELGVGDDPNGNF